MPSSPSIKQNCAMFYTLLSHILVTNLVKKRGNDLLHTRKWQIMHTSIHVKQLKWHMSGSSAMHMTNLMKNFFNKHFSQSLSPTTKTK